MTRLTIGKAAIGLFVIVGAGQAEGDPTHFGIGAGGSVKDKEYVGVDNDVSAIPVLFFDNDWLRFSGQSLDIKLAHLGGAQLSLHSEFDIGKAYKESDSSIFDGMEDRKGSIWVGAKLSWHSVLDSSITVVGDASGYSHGQKANIAFSKKLFLSRQLSFRPFVSANLYSANYVDYYYGVRADEARDDRPEYTGGFARSLTAGVNVSYAFDRHQSVAFNVKREFLDSEITDSPLVGQDYSQTATLYYFYLF